MPFYLENRVTRSLNGPEGTSVDSAAMRTVSVIYNQIMDIGCFSHTLDLVGEHMTIL